MSPAPGASLADLLVEVVRAWCREHGHGLVVGVSGPQGSGKTTACAEAASRLEAVGLRTAVLALDDLYLPRRDRERLARDVHPLLLTRGPPGTHDAVLGAEVLDALRQPGPVRWPRFDKARDDRGEGPAVFVGPADVVLFEGWCVGVGTQPPDRLPDPINTLEREEDAGGGWRAHVNAQLAGPYRDLWSRLDRLVLLLAPDWDTVCGWRAGAEAELRARTGAGMTEAELARFMAHYERLARWAAEDLPSRADLVVRLDARRRPLAQRQAIWRSM